MVGLGTRARRADLALLTDMDQPLGRTAGNAVEVAESVEVLAGGGPDRRGRADRGAGPGDGRRWPDCDVDPAEALADGRAMDGWRAMVAAQGGDPDAPLPVAAEKRDGRRRRRRRAPAPRRHAVGVAAWRLGAGRARKEDDVSATAGVICHAKVGDVVRAGEPLLELRTDEAHRFATAREALADAWTIGPDPAEPLPLILDRITPD